MFNILVAVDGAACTERVLAKVLKLCAESGAREVAVINVQPEPIVYGEVAAYVDAAKARAMAQAAGQRIVDDAARTLQGAGIAARCTVAIGDAAPTIAAHADKNGYNLIAMGTRGMGAVGNLVLGSVATKVVHLARTPVMLIH